MVNQSEGDSHMLLCIQTSVSFHTSVEQSAFFGRGRGFSGLDMARGVSSGYSTVARHIRDICIEAG